MRGGSDAWAVAGLAACAEELAEEPLRSAQRVVRPSVAQVAARCLKPGVFYRTAPARL